MREDVLTKLEIEEILAESVKDKYSDPGVLMFGLNKTSIFRLSRETGLILIFGNEHIGYNHIIDRHSQTSRIPYWNNDKVGTPSKIPLGIAPIQYLTLAEKLYKRENKKSPKEGPQRDFDVYEGFVPYKESQVELRLVTYKNTGIIQTLYPIEKQPKQILKNLRRGFVSNATYYNRQCLQTFEFSYFDQNNTERFKILLRSSEIDRTDKWFVQVNDELGLGKFTTLIKEEPLNKMVDFQIRMTMIDFMDASWIEHEIKSMMTNT